MEIAASDLGFVSLMPQQDDRCLKYKSSFKFRRHSRQRILRCLAMAVGFGLLGLGVLALSSFLHPAIGQAFRRYVDDDEMSYKPPFKNKHWDRSDSILAFVESSPAAVQQPLQGSLFCFVVTAEKFYDSRVPAVNETWLPRCDHGEFFTHSAIRAGDDLDIYTPYSTVFAGLSDAYENLFAKTIWALHFTYKHMSSKFDWYFKADDDTYTVVENLRELLSKFDPRKPLYIGFRMNKQKTNSTYNSGGAGYVLSKGAMEMFNDLAFFNQTICPSHIYEDLGLGNCLENLGIATVDTRNSRGQQRFNAYHFTDVIETRISNIWIKDLQISGQAAIGDDLITMHHLSPTEMRLFERLIYNVKPSQRFRHLGHKTQPDIPVPKYISENAQEPILAEGKSLD